MSGEIHTYQQPGLKKYIVKNGEVRYSPNKRTYKYQCKLHHPDAAEIAQIHAELAAGDTKKAVAIRHDLGTTCTRINRLLVKFPSS